MLNPRKNPNVKMPKQPVLTQVKENKMNNMLDELHRRNQRREAFNMTQQEFKAKQQLANYTNEKNRLQGQLYSTTTPGLREQLSTRVTNLKEKIQKKENMLANPIRYLKHISIK